MLVVWCICNRVDLNDSSITEEVTPNMFHGYIDTNPVIDEIKEMVIEVLDAWSAGEEALVYPPYATTPDYLYFGGDGQHNWFREEY